MTVAKAAGTNAPEYEKPTGLSVCVGRALGDIVLLENWAWADGAASVGDTAGEKTFVAVFTSEDTDDYNTVTMGISVSVTEHTGDWLVTKEAGIGSEGEETRICTHCGETETRPIPAKEFPVWAIVLICVGCTAIVSGIIAVVIVIRKRK